MNTLCVNQAAPKNTQVILPFCGSIERTDTQVIVETFMGHIRQVPCSRMEIKILSAVQFTADMLGFNDDYIAKILVDHGLRAPRMAFPAEFLSYADMALQRSGWEVGGPTQGLLDLKLYWHENGEDRLAAFRHEPLYALPKVLA